MQHLYESIFTRKSIRKYDMTPLSDEKLEEIKNCIREAKPLDENIHCEIVIKKTDEMKSTLKAPYYLCMYSEEKGVYLMNTGYLLQQIDLMLSSMDLGTCWIGMAKPEESVHNGMPFVMTLAFGTPAEPVHRTSTDEFKRKNIEAFADLPDLKSCEGLLTPVRLAPSATNSQPWLFSADEKTIIISREKLNMLKAPFLTKFNSIDIGIAMCHLQISANHLGKTAVFDFEPREVAKGSIFMAAASFKSIE